MKALLLKPDLAKKVKSGAKTQTRRPLPCNVKVGDILFVPEITYLYGRWLITAIKNGKPKLRFEVSNCGPMPTLYSESKPANIVRPTESDLGKFGYAFRSPLHCRAKDARLFLKVTGRYDEALQNISEQDAIAEGIERCDLFVDHDYKDYELSTIRTLVLVDGTIPESDRAIYSFRTLWDSINGQDPAKCWAANPTVAAITFEVTENPFKK